MEINLSEIEIGNQSLVSIITPSYNASSLLKKQSNLSNLKLIQIGK